MDGGNVLGTGLTFLQLLITMGVLIGGLIAIKITLNFDLNKHFGSRQEKLKARCKNACLHFDFVVDQGSEVQVRSFFVSPSGTLNYICQRCGLIKLHLDNDDFQRQVDYYAKNIEEYHKQNRRFRKLLKRAGQI